MERKFYNIVFYSFDDMLSCINILDNKNEKDFEWCKDYRYAYCLHNSDSVKGKLKKSHYHLQLEFVNRVKSDRLFKLIGNFVPNQSEIAIKPANEGGYAYLIHANALDKFQYNIEDVVCNFDRLELEELILKHTKLPTHTKNALFINQLFFILDEDPKINSVNKLCRYLVKSVDNYDLLGWVSRNVYLVSNLISANIASKESEFDES